MLAGPSHSTSVYAAGCSSVLMFVAAVCVQVALFADQMPSLTGRASRSGPWVRAMNSCLQARSR